ncbi:MAG: hypothetical protein L0154_12840 [Chloroflexi bacterium]|nr:hypothetical protein [Chloroflexota bacterium]
MSRENGNNGSPENDRAGDYIPVLWVTRRELLQAMAGFEDDIAALTDEQRTELIERMGEALRLIYLDAIPTVLIDCLSDLTDR